MHDTQQRSFGCNATRFAGWPKELVWERRTRRVLQSEVTSPRLLPARSPASAAPDVPLRADTRPSTSPYRRAPAVDANLASNESAINFERRPALPVVRYSRCAAEGQSRRGARPNESSAAEVSRETRDAPCSCAEQWSTVACYGTCTRSPTSQGACRDDHGGSRRLNGTLAPTIRRPHRCSSAPVSSGSIVDFAFIPPAACCLCSPPAVLCAWAPRPSSSFWARSTGARRPQRARAGCSTSSPCACIAGVHVYARRARSLAAPRRQPGAPAAGMGGADDPRSDRGSVTGSLCTASRPRPP